jgi:alpha-D-xyloside xylohydrolase
MLFEGNPKHEDKVYDAFDPEARDLYWHAVKSGLFDLDIDAWWMDGTEPEFEDCHETLRHKASAVRQRDTKAGSWARVLNAYSLATCTGVYEHQRAETERKRVFILTRSSFLGQQRNGAAVWSGDISATWSTFANQIPAGLNFCATGQPYWTTDNGAFFVRGRGAAFPEGVTDPAFRELFLRWFQYSCFCPLMRSHGTQTPREIWQFGEAGEVVYDSLKAFAELRARLMPYSYSLAAETCFAHATPMRPLGLAYPEDPHCHDIGDQFLYGDAFMACPVTSPMVHHPQERLVPFSPGDLSDDDGRHGALSMYSGDGETLSPTCLRSVIAIDESWAGNKPAGVTGEHYSVAFSGRLRVPAQGGQLLLRGAGSASLQVDDREIVQLASSDQGISEQEIDLSPYAGRQVSLSVTYRHQSGDAVIQCGWLQALQEHSQGKAQQRPVYLPTGTWWDFWTGAAVQGGQTLQAEAPLERMPVYVRAGSIVTLGPAHKPSPAEADKPLELRIYPGADGQTVLYEDSGNSYDYEHGAFSRIDLSWNDAQRTLTIGPRSGSFDGMAVERSFDIVIVAPGQGCGIATSTAHRCAYRGEPLSLTL